MSHFKYFLTTAAISVFLSMQALAATASISFSDPTVTVGSEVNVTMKVSSPDGTLSRSDITLGYDSSLLEFISGTDAEGGAGTIRVNGATNGAETGTLEYNLKFNTLASGSAKVSLSNFEVYDTDESIAEITHQGSSTVTISSAASASNNAILASLVVSPGTLTPEFVNNVTDYSVIVGTSVDTLAINAVTADTGATVAVTGNEQLNMGENNVAITVTAADGSTQATYNIKVTKQEGGPNADDAAQNGVPTETVNEGVKLSSKEKTITIMNPGSDVVIPEGFAESTIDIDGHQVKGWVWKHDSDHQYCIVYGMNDAGELNFYRYDLQEKTLQRYFEDPVAEDIKTNAEKYPEVVERYDKLVGQYNSMFILACALGGIVIILLIFMIVVLTQRRHMPQHGSLRSMKDQNDAKAGSSDDSVPLDETIAFNRIGNGNDSVSSDDSSDPELEMTRIITKNEKADYNMTKNLSQVAASSGLDLEDLDEEDEALSVSESSDSKEDMGATKAFDFNKEWKKSNLKDTKISSSDDSKANKTSSDSGLDIEDL
ncbi:Cadherin-like beta sandwich domain-containing protein [Oribacterium sp. KHPX15]|uniref:cadherin-like beta sandwich domain-containing protein n=1 Tax=Oribacterium sp. KHPX15 TaxID=1855342 RepID=UPI000899629F|nr:cadherin-like beta sandwich domain-containing protein [Oribacterium sp. KHPX15]SDZ88321.1 Cadherin-like beta sandwich domain-containing protein [Oribacterium sp. KHPX15]